MARGCSRGGIPRKNATTADYEINFLSRAMALLVHAKRRAARHASLIRSWHNDCASRVAGSESSVLQPATTRILPRRPAFFTKFPVTYELARSRMKRDRARYFSISSHTVGLRDAVSLLFLSFYGRAFINLK